MLALRAASSSEPQGYGLTQDATLQPVDTCLNFNSTMPSHSTQNTRAELESCKPKHCSLLLQKPAFQQALQ